ncbi:levodione reductase [Roseibium sp. TrichSKD4]|uniref:SDR family NAD(P)-dependent oxidoreductase n=1 Tax=Roseibium sp. TrichSKD4 TaxID=744980 RepID=UPI0001E567A2|nr:SDR family oxidoreductase [Roseibium sp. TrichSKD4]EFO31224.1 levodione reductase [Roseibium sp. TrichSKD4]
MSPHRFDQTVVQITGAARGFGRLAAQRFSAEGALLALSDVDGEKLKDVAVGLRAKGCRVLAEQLDVTVEAGVAAHFEAVKEEFGLLDVAINNAGRAHPLTSLPSMDLETFEKVMTVNTRGVFLGLKYQIPQMLKQGEGTILNMASVAGLVGAGYLAAYAASKHAIVGLTRSAADEVAGKGIRINALGPAFAHTPMLDQMTDQLAIRHGLTEDEAARRLTKRIPMKRTIQPEEVIDAMLWMCSPGNSAMTGQAIAVDGGLTAI